MQSNIYAQSPYCPTAAAEVCGKHVIKLTEPVQYAYVILQRRQQQQQQQQPSLQGCLSYNTRVRELETGCRYQNPTEKGRKPVT